MAASPARLEVRRRRSAHLIAADQVDREDALELVGVEQVHALVRDRLGDGGIVDQHIEPPEAVDRRLDQPHAVGVLAPHRLRRRRPRAPAALHSAATFSAPALLVA